MNTCKHIIDEEKTKQLNGGYFGYGTQEYICKKCGKQYHISMSDRLGRSGYSKPSNMKKET